jgi:hypothetical protein
MSAHFQEDPRSYPKVDHLNRLVLYTFKQISTLQLSGSFHTISAGEFMTTLSCNMMIHGLLRLLVEAIYVIEKEMRGINTVL